MDDILKVGDKMRFSVALIEQIRELPAQQTELVVVVQIREDPDGVKTVWLKLAT